jgi:hypothetical protein
MLKVFTRCGRSRAAVRREGPADLELDHSALDVARQKDRLRTDVLLVELSTTRVGALGSPRLPIYACKRLISHDLPE